ncbi:hypothetical protein BSKO_06673 [Bryopsis sp. KO-2023]|nr:hypothetical protein BSKO_06673 [Bryopsis sp. KO-2023]
MYRDKLRMMLATGTSVMHVLHSDRHYGAIWARILSVDADSVRQLGFWNGASNMSGTVYGKTFMPDSLASHSGFESAASFDTAVFRWPLITWVVKCASLLA